MKDSLLNSGLFQLGIQNSIKSQEVDMANLESEPAFFDQLKPYLGQIFIGAFIGFIAAYTFKKIARSLAILIIAVGIIFFLLNNYTDLVDIDLITIKDKVVDAKDIALKHKETVISKVKDFLLTNIPFVSGFLIGFYGGLRFASKK
jgi:uncharacterized membrane protein (Fun14 family)